MRILSTRDISVHKEHERSVRNDKKKTFVISNGAIFVYTVAGKIPRSEKSPGVTLETDAGI